jgi:biopolymer transport protein ExbD
VPARLQRVDAYRKYLTPPSGGVFLHGIREPKHGAHPHATTTDRGAYPACGIARSNGERAMAFASEQRNAPFATINITPLVDVMLVLLVIFMIAAPVLTRTIDLTLPGMTSPTRPQPSPMPIALRIDAAGTVYWNETATPLSALQPMLQSELQRDPGNPPLLKIDASGETDYGIVAKVLAAARNADWDRIAFVLE